MPGLHTLDRVIGNEWPRLATEDDQRAFEAVPYEERIAAQSTYEALRIGAAAAPPDAPAIVFLPNAKADEAPIRISHKSFFGRVTQVANALHGLGVGPNDVVSMLLPLVPQAFYALYGAQAAGIVNPVNPFLEPAQIAHILHAAGTKVLIALGPTEGFDIWDKVLRVREELPDLRAVLMVNGTAGDSTDDMDFNSLVARQPADRLVSGREIGANDIGAYYHTGGTTGLPQLVPLTHGNQVYQAWGLALMWHMQPGSSLLMGLPLFHVGGSLTHGLQTLCAGGSLIVLSAHGWRNKNAMPNIWRLVERYKPHVLAAVPTVLGAVLNTPIEGRDVSSLKLCSGGGSTVPVPVADAYKHRFGMSLLETYGMTEVSSCHTISYPERPVYLGSVGHALPYSRVRVVDVDERGKTLRDCETGKIGVVTMHGPGVFSGYATGAPDAPFVEPGWVNSGDLGRVDAHGYLWITGRAKDLIIRGGHNIDPSGIEEVLYEHPAVEVAAVVGEPDGYAGELPVAFVQLKAGTQGEAGEILRYAAARTPERAAIPTQLYLLDSMPLTAVGKVFKPTLRQDAAKRAVERLLAFLPKEGCSADVKVEPDAKRGTIIRVRLSGAEGAGQEDLVAKVKAKLDPLPIAHELTFGKSEETEAEMS